MIILGIDPGTAATGYGIVKKEPRGLRCIVYGCIRTNKSDGAPTRLRQIRENLLFLVKSYKPDCAAIEQLFFANNTKTAVSVAHARGVIMESLGTCGIPVYEHTPLQVKQAITGYGRADKAQMQKMVQVLLSLNEIPMPDDAADALATAICCAHSMNNNA